MAMTLTNLDKTLLILALNSGNALYLAPGESSGPVEAIELNDNRKVEKLVKSGLLKVTTISESKPATATTRPSKSEPEPAMSTTGQGKQPKGPK